MSTYAMECLEHWKEIHPDWLAGPLIRSQVTEQDIQAAETALGYAFPEPFREFLQSYILPEEHEFYLKTVTDLFAGNVYYSIELDRFLTLDEIYEIEESEDIDVWNGDFYLEGLIGVSDVSEHSLLENITRSTWTETAAEGLIYLGACFEYNYLFLDCSTGKIIYIDREDIYDLDYSKVIRERGEVLFNDFNDMLKCICFGAVIDADTQELVEESEQ